MSRSQGVFLGKGASALTVKDEGVIVSQATELNFVGANVTASDAGGGKVEIQILGGGGTVTSVNGLTGAVIITPDDLNDAATTNKFMSEAEKLKLANISDNFKGLYADAASRDIGVPVPTSGMYILQDDTDTFWFYDGVSWINTDNTSSGDMVKVIYDPTNISADVFNTDNHVAGTTTTPYLKTDRDKLITVQANATANQTDAYLLNRANHTGNLDLGTW